MKLHQLLVKYSAQEVILQVVEEVLVALKI